MDSSVTCSNHSQTFDMQLLLRPKKVAFWWNFLSCKWSSDLMIGGSFFWCFSCLGEGKKEDKAICPIYIHFLLPSGSQSWAVWPMSRGMSWASKSKLAMTFKHFSHRLPAEQMFVQCILLHSAYVFPYFSLYNYNRLCRECFFGCYCTEDRPITVSLYCIPSITSK